MYRYVLTYLLLVLLGTTTMQECGYSVMAKQRALLTETERRQIAGEEGSNKKYQATSRVRRRIDEELPEDLDILRRHNQDLLTEFYDVAGPIFYCPVCGDPFVELSNVIKHTTSTGDEAHKDLSTEQLKQMSPDWWKAEAPEEWETLENSANW